MPIKNKNLFQRLFPPPEFLKMPASGVDISDESIHFTSIKDGKNGFIIKNFGERKIPNGVITSGYVKEPQEFARILDSLKKDLPSSFISVSLPEQHAYLLKLKLPKMKASEIRSSIELQLEDNIPISVAEAVFDYEVVENSNESDMEVELSAFPRAIVENYLSMFKEVGLYPTAFEIEAQAIARSVIEYGDSGTFMIIDFGKIRTGISIVSGGLVRFASTVDIGGNTITKAVENLLKVSREEAERLKKEKGVVGKKDNEELFLTMMSVVAVLKEEVRKHYLYWHTHKDPYGKKRPKVEKIILCGGDANLKGLPEYLSTDLNIEVGLANVIVNINSLSEYIPEMNFEDSLHYATAIGLALRSPA